MPRTKGSKNKVKKTTKKIVKTIENITNEVPYHLYLKVNGITRQIDATDLKASILECKPVQVYTSLHIIISKGKASLSRYFPQVGQVNIFFRQGIDNFIMNATRILK